MHRLLLVLAFSLSSVLLFMGNVQAGAGHDHGHDMPEPANSATDNTPRLVMSSEQFELVGTIEGRHMHLYLDDFDTNAPIPDANIELEIAGTSLQAEDEGNGIYHITLADELEEEGVHPVLATVLTETNSDLLTGELDIHIEEQEQEEVLKGILVTPSQLIIISCLISAFFLLLIIVMRRDIHRREQAS